MLPLSSVHNHLNDYPYYRLSGLIIDVFGDLAVIASSAAWVEKYKEHIKKCISGFNVVKSIIWRSSTEILKEEGLDLADLDQQDLSESPERVKVKDIIVSSFN